MPDEALAAEPDAACGAAPAADVVAWSLALPVAGRDVVVLFPACPVVVDPVLVLVALSVGPCVLVFDEGDSGPLLFVLLSDGLSLVAGGGVVPPVVGGVVVVSLVVGGAVVVVSLVVGGVVVALLDGVAGVPVPGLPVVVVEPLVVDEGSEVQ